MKRFFTLILGVVGIVISVTCSPDDTQGELPEVATISASNITINSALSGGNIYTDGGRTITAKGIVWSTSENPTVSLETKTNVGSGIGPFSSFMKGLEPNTTYYVRAYATNKVGIAYGSQILFVTTVLVPTTPTTPTPTPTAVLPTVTTSNITDLYGFSAKSGGTITSDGGVPITVLGVVWSTSPNPTVSLVTKTVYNYFSINEFISHLTDLKPDTTYYVRAYATNSNGTGYGNEVSFKTIEATNAIGIVSGEVTDIDGNIYPVVTVCDQTWTTNNLNVSHYRNGDVIPQVTDPKEWDKLSTGAWCYYENNTANGPVYGKLYNWFAVADPRGLAPTGYHVASSAEWEVLTSCLGGIGVGSISGGKMKEAGTTHWSSPNTGATNSSKFSALPGGTYTPSGFYDDLYDGVFEGISKFGSWWCSDSTNPCCGKTALLEYNSAIFPGCGNVGKTAGYSVRCLKD